MIAVQNLLALARGAGAKDCERVRASGTANLVGFVLFYSPSPFVADKRHDS